MRYSVHDGPGIRTTVFFKGCPLSCKWCHNPEGLQLKPQEIFNAKKCIKCGRCDNCPTGARETVGYEITVPDLMEKIKGDVLFYEQSGGGVTFSGGEPFFQPEFLLQVLNECKREYIGTAIDTSGFCETEIILKAAEIADYILYDIKLMDREKHINYCGVSNDLILENLKALAGVKTKLLLRIPIIPSINDGMEEMSAIFNFVKDFDNIQAVHLLPYHNIQSDKYKRMSMDYSLSEILSEDSPNLAGITDLFNTKFPTKTGG
jgi:pyruvate formate lyase activating enzyme